MEQRLNFIEKILQNRILSHGLFWFSTLIIFAIYGKGIGWSFWVGFIMKLFFLPVQMLATYYLLYYQIPTLLYPKRYFRFAISFGLSVLVFCTLASLTEDLGLVKILHGYGNNIRTFWEIMANPSANVGYNAEDVYLTVFMVVGLRFIKDRMEEKTQMDILEQEKAQAEINLLKAQVNPRILSKALYQLHDLTKQQSDAAPEVVIKLSEMLDYMLYRCNGSKVLMKNEINLVQNYLDLEQLQHDDHLKVHFFHSLKNPFAEITPLLLLTFVELFLQQDAKAIASYPSPSLKIILQENDGQLTVRGTSTYLMPTMPAGINFRKQLELTYPEKNKFEIQPTENKVTFELRINL